MSDPEPLEPTPQLKAVLSRMASNYVPGGVEVEFHEGAATVAPGEGGQRPTVYVDPALPANLYGIEGPDALRLLVNSISHECEHVRESGLDDKRAFCSEYPDAIRPVAGFVVNVVEDQFIDANRTTRYPGLARIERWAVQHMMQDDEFRAPLTDIGHPMNQLAEGMMQLAIASGVKGISDADPTVRQMLNRIHPILQAAKTEPDRQARQDMAHDVMAIIEPMVQEALDEYDEMMEQIKRFLDDLMEQAQEMMAEADYDAAEQQAQEEGMAQAGYAGVGDEDEEAEAGDGAGGAGGEADGDEDGEDSEGGAGGDADGDEDGGTADGEGDADGDEADGEGDGGGSTDGGGDDGAGGTGDEEWVVRPITEILGDRTPRDTVIQE